MKLLVFLALSIALSNALPTTSQEDFGQAMRAFLTKMKEQMNCPMGSTPTLAPFTMDFLPLKKVQEGLK